MNYQMMYVFSAISKWTLAFEAALDGNPFAATYFFEEM